MDDKSIEKTTSALNGHGIARDYPTIWSGFYIKGFDKTLINFLWNHALMKNTEGIHRGHRQ